MTQQQAQATLLLNDNDIVGLLLFPCLTLSNCDRLEHGALERRGGAPQSARLAGIKHKRRSDSTNGARLWLSCKVGQVGFLGGFWGCELGLMMCELVLIATFFDKLFCGAALWRTPHSLPDASTVCILQGPNDGNAASHITWIDF